mmetsp:Transcript_35939/g.58105  ORF Transcript_35939/g.58105 Transcript_35939/m.58105 type:complete len:84 (+) Transcript_35939:119-370(+)
MAFEQQKNRQTLYRNRRAVERADRECDEQNDTRIADELELKYERKERKSRLSTEQKKRSPERAANNTLGSTCGTADLHASACH